MEDHLENDTSHRMFSIRFMNLNKMPKVSEIGDAITKAKIEK